MHPSEYANLARHEQHYWWFIVKRRLLQTLLRAYVPPTASPPRLLDLGCGPGGNLAVLREFSPAAIGFDYAPEALAFARRQSGVHLGQADILRLPLPDHALDLVTVLDVLYHQWIGDDRHALREVYRVLKPGGSLILTDSAFAFLGGPHDEVNLAARRYTRPQMRQKLQDLGFQIKKESYLYAFLFPVALARRWFQRQFGGQQPPASDIQPLPPWLNATLLKLACLEQGLLPALSLPVGTSILFVASKPG